METRGLVARHPTDDDGRGAMITLTDQGWTTLRKAAPHHVESVRRTFIDLLDDQEIATLGRIAEKVIARLSD
jgi:DNA-binding MarR family transcriptional regulator